jgi:hypothetical protein
MGLLFLRKYCMKKGNSKKKGSSFEREISKKLSLWWTNNSRDDVFWLTSGSGARATVRSKTKKSTFGQYGDIQATDPIGQPFIDICNIELKRGYNTATLSNVLDKTTKSKRQQLESFIIQAKNDAKAAKARVWLLVHKRDRRDPLLYCHYSFLHALIEKDVRKNTNITYFVYENDVISVIKFYTFLEIVTANKFKEIFNEYKDIYIENKNV